jgi:hypothetical protein
MGLYKYIALPCLLYGCRACHPYPFVYHILDNRSPYKILQIDKINFEESMRLEIALTIIALP